MNRKQSLRQAFILACAFQFSFFIFSATAQVTIGSDAAPNAGALLDLKENADGTSSKGFNLPKVFLVSLTSLQPCLTAAEEAAPGAKALHKGLQVYNTNPALAEGVTTWDGSSWSHTAVPKVVNTLTIPKVSFVANEVVTVGTLALEPGAYICDIEYAIKWADETATEKYTSFCLRYAATNTNILLTENRAVGGEVTWLTASRIFFLENTTDVKFLYYNMRDGELFGAGKVKLVKLY
ncbi:hypothetical protein D0T49_06920 [Paludibacter sp. 221]|uniref:hypothetical protein n=1 Tax=Paludibacter sp. 221 TaxID=2302939 RepID=UPI0013D3248E|nr:hypothetical protein [Paludibacter sp. 221]NDV46776.1 hypothetical protein [Paludibacter sp. 221]